ncbi:helicase associated domain-containing protein, partial [Streptomyces sp. YPW6]
LADLVDADGALPAIAPGVVFDGDDIGRWLKRQKNPGTWALLLPEQQERLAKLGVQSDQATSPAPAATPTAKGPSKAQQAFQRGVQALAQYIAREGHHRVPRAHAEEIAVDGETEPVTVKLGVWISNTKSRRNRLTADQLTALAELGVSWAR